MFDQTISYAKLKNSDTLSSNPENDNFLDDEENESQEEQESVQQQHIEQPARKAPPPPSEAGGSIRTPISVAFTGDTIQVSATLTDKNSVERLIKALTANKELLEN